MTIRVIIEHAQPGYDKDIQITVMNDDLTVVKEQPTIVHAGTRREFYVYPNQKLLIAEHSEGINSETHQTDL